MATVRLPDRAFKVKFKIFRFGFTDFDVFVRRLTEAAYWRIANVSESSHTYTFENDWNIALHPHGDISLYSPLLRREEAVDVYRIIDVLIAMDVRLGENCEVEMHYEGDSRIQNRLVIFPGVPVAVLSATALILFLATKVVQIFYHELLTVPTLIFFETAGFTFSVAFAYFLYKTLNRSIESFEEVLMDASKESVNKDFMHDEDVQRKLRDRLSIHAIDLVKEISYPLENIMAYTRFYANHSEQDTQHWRDLMEIMEQAIRIRTLMNRAEARATADGEVSKSDSDPDKRLFRKSQRRMDLIPVVIRGTDLLGEHFETPSYTLNINETGACLLLPDGMVAIGQTFELQNHEFRKWARVRWVVEGKMGNMMFAGVEFVSTESPQAYLHEGGKSEEPHISHSTTSTKE